jgi:hypothetical protein
MLSASANDAVSSAVSLEDWLVHLGECGQRLTAAATAGAWLEAETLMASYATLLHNPPVVDHTELAPAFKAAELVMSGLKAQAAPKHQELADEIRQLGRGRRAVASYI